MGPIAEALAIRIKQDYTKLFTNNEINVLPSVDYQSLAKKVSSEVFQANLKNLESSRLEEYLLFDINIVDNQSLMRKQHVLSLVLSKLNSLNDSNVSHELLLQDQVNGLKDYLVTKKGKLINEIMDDYLRICINDLKENFILSSSSEYPKVESDLKNRAKCDESSFEDDYTDISDDNNDDIDHDWATLTLSISNYTEVNHLNKTDVTSNKGIYQTPFYQSYLCGFDMDDKDINFGKE